MAEALLLTETMAPEAYEAAHEAMRVFGVEDRIELYQSTADRSDNARLVLYGRPIGVEFVGNYLDGLDRGQLLAVLGHEIGHALAHHGHPEFAAAASAAQYGATPEKRAYSMAAELTADRFGLLACRDLDAALRLEMRANIGSARSIRFDTTAYLDQCRSVGEELSSVGGMAMGRTHPEHYVRGYAEWLFVESDLYRELTGKGRGARPIAEVNALLSRLVAVRQEPASPGATAKPTPRSTPMSERASHIASPAASPIVSEGQRADPRAHARPTRLADARAVLGSAARAAAPPLRKFLDAARGHFAPGESAAPSDAAFEPDPLAEERRELEARFEELERRLSGDQRED